MADSPDPILQPPLYSSLSPQPILCEMVELFVDEMPPRMARMAAYFERRDWDGLRRSATRFARWRPAMASTTWCPTRPGSNGR